MDEPRLDNDANHERDWGISMGPDIGVGASGAGMVASSSEAGKIPVTFEGDDDSSCTRSGCGSSRHKVVRTENGTNDNVRNASRQKPEFNHHVRMADPRSKREKARI